MAGSIEEQIAWIGKVQYWFQDREEADMLGEIKKSLKRLQKLEQRGGYEKYKDFIRVYDEFCKGFIGVGAKIDGVQGRAMKMIIKYLIQQSKDHSEEGALAAWEYILKNWTKLSDFIQTQTSLAQINKNLQEILTQLRHAGKKTNQGAAHSVKQRVARRQQHRNSQKRRQT